MGRAVAVLITTALMVSCGDETSDPRYSADALADGVTVEVDDPDNLVQSATVFLADELTTDTEISSRLADGDVVVLQPGPIAYDAVVVYRTGPYCGLLPDVEAHDGERGIEIDVRSRTEGDCDAMEYDEALGLNFVAAHADDEVTARHGDP
jgi:hypothetical protein